MASGLEIRTEDTRVFADNVAFGSSAQSAGIDFDYEITLIEVNADRPPKQWMFLPAILLLGLVWFLQKRRQSAV